MAYNLQIHLLGPFEVWRDDQPLPPAAWPGHKVRNLLKILVTHRQRIVPSDELIEWLWPNLTPESARNSLWVAASRLRRLLEPETAGRGDSTFIRTEPPGYRFDPAGGCEIDVDAFLGHVRAGQEHQRRGEWAETIAAYRAAQALYRGDYLVEDPYEDWAISTREQLREAFLEMENDLAACYLAQGRYHEALVHCHRVLTHDACRESAWRLAMECYYRAGERGQALRAFERCRTALARELGVEPLPETVILHERIIRDEMQRSGGAEGQRAREAGEQVPAPVLRLPFVGRDREWALLNGLLHEARNGRGHIVLVTGEPGIGKTRLLDELAGLATARGLTVLVGRCYELEQNLAYAPLLEALRTILSPTGESPPAPDQRESPCPPTQLAAVAELWPELRRIYPDLPPYRPLPPDEERLRVLTGLAHILLGCAGDSPLVLLLDDLHWADPSTLQLLHYLGRQVRDRAILLLGTYRFSQVDAHHPLSPLLVQLARQGVLTELSLPAFGEDDVILLLHSLGYQQPGDPLAGPGQALARRLYRDTEGHPFFLAEVLRTFIQEGLIIIDANGHWRTAYDEMTDSYRELLLPPNVRAAALGRLDRLSPGERSLLDLASVIGREFGLPLLARLLDRPEGVLVEQADRLAARGFLRLRPPDGYEFSHDLMRRAAYEALSEPRRRLLHRHVADGLLALSTSPLRGGAGGGAGRVATHYAASDRPWLALEHALAAAEQAAHVVAYDEALAWCRQALEIVQAHPMAALPGFRTRLHLQWRTLWYYQGDLERSLAAGRAALAAARQERDVAAELQALWYLAHDETQVAAGGPSDTQAQSQALDLACQLGDPAALARSLARLGSDTGFLAAPPEREQALESLKQAEALARQTGDPLLLHDVLAEQWGVGRLPQARAALEEALALAGELGDRREEAGTLAKLADLLVRQGDFQAAVEYARQGLELADRVDSPPYGAWNRRALGLALVALGQADEGVGHLEKAIRIFEAHAWRAMLAGTLLRLGLALGNVLSLPALGIAEGSKDQVEGLAPPASLCLRGDVSTTGDRERATAALERVLALSRETREPYEAAYALAILGRLRLADGDEVAGRQALEQATALSLQIGLPWHRGGTLLQVAAGRLLLGEIEMALESADKAIRLAEEDDLREVRAYGLWLRGQALRALGRPDEACAALEAGLAQAEAIGQAWLQQRLATDLAGF